MQFGLFQNTAAGVALNYHWRYVRAAKRGRPTHQRSKAIKDQCIRVAFAALTRGLFEPHSLQ